MAPEILIIMIAAIALTIFAERWHIQAPLLLAAAGIAASFIPGLPHVDVPTNILLGLVLPPLLYSAALDFSLFSFMRRLSSILNLGVFLVLVTAFAGAVAVSWIIPGMPFMLALLLGAVVAPPDAVSAVAIGNQLRLPHRVMTILKGESLINDAAALTLFAGAAATLTGGSRFINGPILYFLYSSGAGIAVGVLLGIATHSIRRRLSNPTMITALALILPFSSFTIAEEFHASGVLAVVSAGFVIGHKATDLNFAGRLQERDVWRVIVAMLEAFVFAYIGLQFRHILEIAGREGVSWFSLGLATGVLLATVVAVRFIWVFATDRVARWVYNTKHERRQRERKEHGLPEPLNWRENFIISWTGMRGVVTLAAAAGVPATTFSGEAIPTSGAVLPIAFSVAIGTLLFQGLTLPTLIRRLGVTNAGDAKYFQAQMTHARAIANDAQIEFLNVLMKDRKTKTDTLIAEKLLHRAQREAQEKTDLPEGNTEHHRTRIIDIAMIAKRALNARRSAIIAARNAEKLDDEVMRKVLEDMDLEQAFITRRAERAWTGLENSRSTKKEPPASLERPEKISLKRQN